MKNLGFSFLPYVKHILKKVLGVSLCRFKVTNFLKLMSIDV